MRYLAAARKLGVSTSVVDGIAALANGLKFDIHVQASDIDPATVDNFIDKLVPNLTGMGGASMCITLARGTSRLSFSSFSLPSITGRSRCRD